MKIGLIGGLLLVPAGIYGQTKMESPIEELKRETGKKTNF